MRTADAGGIARAPKDVLRLRTVAPVSVARTLLAEAETQGHVLPAGTVVVVDALSLHRDPELFAQPAAFRRQARARSPTRPDARAGRRRDGSGTSGA